MILKKIIDECKLMHETYLPGDPCVHCRLSGYTCKHTCSILQVKRPCDIEKNFKLLNKEDNKQ